MTEEHHANCHSKGSNRPLFEYKPHGHTIPLWYYGKCYSDVTPDTPPVTCFLVMTPPTGRVKFFSACLLGHSICVTLRALSWLLTSSKRQERRGGGGLVGEDVWALIRIGVCINAEWPKSENSKAFCRDDGNVRDSQLVKEKRHCDCTNTVDLIRTAPCTCTNTVNLIQTAPCTSSLIRTFTEFFSMYFTNRLAGLWTTLCICQFVRLEIHCYNHLFITSSELIQMPLKRKCVAACYFCIVNIFAVLDTAHSHSTFVQYTQVINTHMHLCVCVCAVA
jgi:hypothetical protein